MKVFVIHGPNLDLLGEREINIYGSVSLAEINQRLRAIAKENKAEVECFQSNHEGDIVDKIGKAKGKVDFIIINPAAYTHTSVAIADAIAATSIPTIEVHISNIYKREEFRRKSLIAPVCLGQISGFGDNSYYLALRAVLKINESEWRSGKTGK